MYRYERIGMKHEENEDEGDVIRFQEKIFAFRIFRSSFGSLIASLIPLPIDAVRIFVRSFICKKITSGCTPLV
jgi:hypothetical protein